MRPAPGRVKLLCSLKDHRAWGVGAVSPSVVVVSMGWGKGPREIAEAKTHATRMIAVQSHREVCFPIGMGEVAAGVRGEESSRIALG